MAHQVDRTKETAITETFTPVDGGVNRACRGASSGDNNDAYFTLQSAPDLTGCKRLCEETAGCKGIEYHTSGRCEVWIRPDGIGASTWVALLYLTLLPLPMKLAGFVPIADSHKIRLFVGFFVVGPSWHKFCIVLCSGMLWKPSIKSH